MDHEKKLLRLRKVLDAYPVSKSKWWAGVSTGEYPQPIKLGPRTTAWLASDIQNLIDEKVEAAK